MRVLWVNSNFMHPTTKGGQIRTLEMLRYLHRWHEIHYVALEYAGQPEGPARAAEYSSQAHPYPHQIRDKRSAAFLGELIAGLWKKTPLAVERFHPAGMRAFLEDLIVREKFDRAVVDHLAPTVYFPRRSQSVLFQHNVEFMIWRRHAEQAADPLRRAYFKLQAARMFEYERQACRESARVVACSEVDRKTFSDAFQISHVSTVPTGVAIDSFTPPPDAARAASAPDLVFVGSMDWLPNEQGVLWFAREIFPRIRRGRPNATFAIVGRTPPPAIQALAQVPGITVTGTVPDVRPWFWDAAVSVVPLRVGGGTRLKIYEAMAARTAVVSTTIGAEGLDYDHPRNIRIADDPEDFARQCLDLLQNPAARSELENAAWNMVRSKYSWEAAARAFDQILESAPALS